MGQGASHAVAAPPLEAEELSFHELIAVLPETLQRDRHCYVGHETLARSDATLTQMLVDIRSRFNALAPIDKLPPEIFRYLFELVVQAAEDRTFKTREHALERIPTLRPTRTLTHVSSRWRAIALKTPALWTRADNRSDERLDAYLERSGSMPLSIHLPSPLTRRMKQLLEKHGHRIRRLDFVEQHAFGGHCPPTRLLPGLDCLTVASDCDRVRDDDHDAEYNICGVSPLKALALQPLCTVIPGTSFPCLTHLYLSSFHEREPSDNAMDYLTSLLSSTRVLQHLHLSGLHSSSVNTWAVSTPTPLPSLRSLTCLHCDMAAAPRLLELFELPEDVLVRLDDLSHWHDDEEPGEGHFPRPLPSQRFVASFTHLEVVTGLRVLHVVAEGPRSGLWIQATTEEDHSRPHAPFWSAWICALHEMLPLTSIKTLHISSLDAAILPELLPRLPGLVELVVRFQQDLPQTSVELCAGVLQGLCRTLADSVGGALCCPELQCLAMMDLPNEIHEGLALPDTPSASSGHALRMAQARAEAGKPLRRLALQLRCDAGALERSAETSETFASAVAMFEEQGAHVEVVGNDDPALRSSFKMRDMWNVDGAEEYWELSSAERPRYLLPWN